MERHDSRTSILPLLYLTVALAGCTNAPPKSRYATFDGDVRLAGEAEEIYGQHHVVPSQAQDAATIIHEGVVNATLEAVWAAWTTTEGLKSWLAPHADIELRIGGLMRTNYNPDGRLGDEQTIENTILSYEPMGMLSIKVKRTPDGFPFPNAIKNMWTNMYFEPAGPEQTRIRIVGLGFTSDEESQRMRVFFDEGNAITLKQLQKHFAEALN